jgi:hypothetical protein
MANTASTDLAQQISLRDDHVLTRKMPGRLSTDMDPGSWVMRDAANNQWIPLDTDTCALPFQQVGVVDFKQRLNATSLAEKLITNDYDISEAEDKLADIVISGTVVCKINDQNAAAYVGQKLIASSTAESATLLALAATGAGPTTGTAIRAEVIGELAVDIADDDTWCIANIGMMIGMGPYKAKDIR